MNDPQHTNSPSAHGADHETERIAKEMSPYLIYAAIPILIIVFIALKFGPSY